MEQLILEVLFITEHFNIADIVLGNMHYLYKITDILNNKVYIGQTVNAATRWQAHKSYAKNHEKTGQYIHRAMAKYGIDNFIFEVIATSKNQEDANEFENILITQYDSRNKEYGYNVKPGGFSRGGWQHSEKTKNILSVIHKGNQYALGYHHTDEAKNKMSQAANNRSEETRRKISKSLKGNIRAKGHKHSEETKIKIGEATKKRYQKKEL